MWHKNIEVALKIRGLRVGRGYPAPNTDLPAVPPNYIGSSIKGIIRKSAQRVLKVTKGLENAFFEIFGYDSKEGKIQIYVKPTDGRTQVRYGIKVDPKFCSAKKGHLFVYEFFIVDHIKFNIIPVLPLEDREAILIFFSLNALRYENLGGFGSRGLGLIEDVKISSEFEEFIRRCDFGKFILSRS